MTAKLESQQQPWKSQKDNHLRAHACYKERVFGAECEVKYNQQHISQLYVPEIWEQILIISCKNFIVISHKFYIGL